MRNTSILGPWVKVYRTMVALVNGESENQHHGPVHFIPFQKSPPVAVEIPTNQIATIATSMYLSTSDSTVVGELLYNM